MLKFAQILPALALLLLSSGLSGPVAAQSEPFRVEFRSGWQMDNGNRMVAVHLHLAQGWKTYWRAPGDNGIPPSFDWDGSRNVKSVRFHWPRPNVYDVGGLQTIGYSTELVLPIEVTPVDPSQPVYLQAAVDLGVCSDICIPAHFEFKADLPDQGADDAAIRSALRKRPSTAKEAGLRQISCVIEPGSDGMQVTAQLDLPSTGGAETVVFEPGNPEIWVSEADITRQGRSLVATVDMVALEGGAFALQRQDIIVTVLGKNRAVEIMGCPSVEN
jgi:DsbC/DsbD-like thiol-disulfide interchange protein